MTDSTSKNTITFFAADMLAGGISGAISKTIAAPLERVKLLLQTQKLNASLAARPYVSPTDCFRRIYAEEGLHAFWRGNLASIYRYFPNHALNFAFKDQYKRMFAPLLPHEQESERRWHRHLVHNIVAGGVAGGLALTVCHPFDVARTKLAADSGVDPSSSLRSSSTLPTNHHVRMYRGTFHCLSETFKSHGVRGLYAGAPVSLVGAVVYRGLHFGLYDTIKDSEQAYDSLFFRFLMAQAVSLAVGVVIYPLDTIRRRMMVQIQDGIALKQRTYRHSFHCAAVMLKEEGVRSFFSGFSVNLFRSMSAALLLVLYDEIKRVGQFL